MPMVFICNHFVIFNPGFPLEFAFLFPYHDDWVILIPQGHQLLICVEDPIIVMFDPHVTSRTISPPRLSAADKGKGTEGRQDLEMEIAQAIEEGGEEAEIAYLVSLWSDQMDSNTGDNLPDHEEVTGRLVTGSRKQEFWE